ncbi:MAG TPA: dihydrofolate reductase family protein [Glaciibacter sp.]|nr:dihydrofolate reductase family protein [Glaciibacter sp.]
MRKLIYNAQTTLNNRIANQDGVFWEPFPWGETEQAFANQLYAGTDTWVMSRKMFEAIVPWWDTVAQGSVPEDVPALTDADLEFARLFSGSKKIAISRTMTPNDDQDVISGDIVPQLQALKEQPGKDIILAAGPATLHPLLGVPGLIDEMLLVIHPAVIAAGPRLFSDDDLALRLIEATPFPAGAVVMRYEVLR